MFIVECDPTPGGVRALRYTPIGGVDASTYESVWVAGDQKKAVLANWSALPATIYTVRVEHEASQTDQGPLFRMTVTAEMSTDSAVNRAEIDALVRQRLLLQVFGRGASVPTILGTLEQPLEFVSAIDSAADPSDATRVSCTFESVSTRPAPFYSPTF